MLALGGNHVLLLFVFKIFEYSLTGGTANKINSQREILELG